MTLMAAGLALTSSPAADAISGALPPAQAGAGSAVNDLTRELGGALGVAVIGSVMASAYSARQSVTVGLAVAAHLPPAVQAAAADAVRQAFTGGLSAGSVVAAIAAAAGAVGVLLFLPARASHPGQGTTPVPIAATTTAARRNVT
jgi:MFS transporter, DHA2 family, multidrug resistance protein